MGGIGADGLVPFGGLIPASQEADDDTKRAHAHPSFEDGIEHEQVHDVEPVAPTLPVEPADPGIGEAAKAAGST